MTRARARACSTAPAAAAATSSSGTCMRLSPHLADHRVGLLRAALLPARARLRARTPRRRRRDRRQADRATRPSSRLHCSPPPRSTARSTTTINIFCKLSYQKVYDAVLATPLGAEGHRVRRDCVRAVPGPHLRRRVLRPHARARPHPLLVGRARAACDGLHRLRLRRRRHRRGHLHAELAGLRHRQPRDPADVPLLGDVLPALDVSRTGSRW